MARTMRMQSSSISTTWPRFSVARSDMQHWWSLQTVFQWPRISAMDSCCDGVINGHDAFSHMSVVTALAMRPSLLHSICILSVADECWRESQSIDLVGHKELQLTMLRLLFCAGCQCQCVTSAAPSPIEMVSHLPCMDYATNRQLQPFKLKCEFVLPITGAHRKKSVT